MADRSIAVRLRAEISDFKRQMDEAAKSTKKIGEAGEESSKRADTAMGRMVQSATKNREAWDRAGTTLTAFGATTTAFVAATVASAIRWESAWTGVLKTVDGTPAQLAAVEDGLRGLARVLPASHTEIAAVAEAAGQLGIQTGNVVDFTKTMIDLGETTNLSAEEAATSLARFSNIMGTSQKDVSRLGAALVGLGNNYATTESEILAMSMRLAGAGRQIGLTEGQTLGLAAAMSSVGIEAEAGGTAMSLTMKRLEKATRDGGAELDLFARVSGMTSADFQKAWRDDAGAALTTFIEGLGRVSASGGSVNAVLEELGITGIREADALLRLSSAGTLAFDAMSQGVREYADGTALLDEANKRYDTTEAKLQIARNAINDAAIEMGSVFLPAVAGAAEGVANLATWFGSLPSSVQGAIGSVSALTGGLSLLAGGFLLTFPRVIETAQAFRSLSEIAPRLSTRLSGVGKSVGKGSAILVGLLALTHALNGLNSIGERSVSSVSQITESLLRAKGISGIAREFEGLTTAFSDMRGAADALFDGGKTGFNRWADETIGPLVGITTTTDKARSVFEAFGQSLATIYSSSPDLAAGLFNEALRETGLTVDQLLSITPAYADALADTNVQQQLAAESGGDLAGTFEEVDPAAQAAADALAEWLQSVADADGSFIDLLGGYQEMNDAARRWAEEQAASTKTTKDSWEDFIDQAATSTQDYLAILDEQVAAQQAWETNMLILSGRVSRGTLDELAKLGPEGAPLVADLVNASDEELAHLEEVYRQRSKEATDSFASNLDQAGPVLAEIAAKRGEEAAAAAAGALASGEKTLQDVLDEYRLRFDIDGNIQPALTASDQLLNDIEMTTPVVKIDANDAPARMVFDVLTGEWEVSSTETILAANADPALSIFDVMTGDWAATTTNTKVGADDSTGRSTVNALTGWAGQQRSSITVGANTLAAESAIAELTRARSVAITAFIGGVVSQKASGGPVERRAAGGAVYGPGTGTSDSIPALGPFGSRYQLSNGEHIWTAAETDAVGGHAAMMRLRRAALAGRIEYRSGGGSVEPLRQPVYLPSNPAPQVHVAAPSVDVAGALNGLSVSLVLDDGTPLRATMRAEARAVVRAGGR